MPVKRTRKRERVTCPWCGRLVAVRLDGEIRRHRNTRGVRCQAPEQLPLFEVLDELDVEDLTDAAELVEDLDDRQLPLV